VFPASKWRAVIGPTIGGVRDHELRAERSRRNYGLQMAGHNAGTEEAPECQ
jgi:hypothetical protein